MERRIIGRVDL